MPTKLKILFIGQSPLARRGLDGPSKVGEYLAVENRLYDATYLSLDHADLPGDMPRHHQAKPANKIDFRRSKFSFFCGTLPFNMYPARLFARSRPEIEAMAVPYDAVVILSSSLSMLVEGLSRETLAKTVVFPIDALSFFFERRVRNEKNPFKRLAWSIELKKTRYWESRVYSKARGALFVSSLDGQACRDFAPGARVETVPAAIDVGTFCPMNEARTVDCILTGNFNYGPNREAYDFINRRLAPSMPDVRFAVVGANGHTLPPPLSPNVAVLGLVDDLVAEINKARLVLAPIFYGAGMKNKVLEAMACGQVVIGTPVAFDNIPAHDGANAYVLDSHEAAPWATRIRDVLAVGPALDGMRKAARATVVENFSWEGVQAKFHQVIKEMTAAP